MSGIEHIGKMLLIIGLVICAAGLLLMFAGKMPWIGKLPGDILIQKKNFTFYLPIATSIILSLILTLIFFILGRR
ncbi:MAG: DUF2905 domain-containing protein [Chloroflexota bacterium]